MVLKASAGKGLFLLRRASLYPRLAFTVGVLISETSRFFLFLFYSIRWDAFMLCHGKYLWFEKKSGIGLDRGRHFLDQKKVAKD